MTPNRSGKEKTLWQKYTELRQWAEAFHADRLLNKLEELQFWPGCVEPGYEDQPVLAANWNKIDHPTIHSEIINEDQKWADFIDLLSKEDWEMEWSDEWDSCGECNKAFRTEPDSMNWTPSYKATEEGLLCDACYKKSIAETLTEPNDKASSD